MPVAAVLAGAVLLQGPRRTWLAGVFLPPAMLLATAWRQSGWGLEYQGYSLQLLPMLAAVLLVSFAGRRWGRKDMYSHGGADGCHRAWYACAGFLAPAPFSPGACPRILTPAR